jgi:hypothetical protein
VSRAGKRIVLYPLFVIGVALNFWQPLTRPSGVSRRASHVDAFKSESWFECTVDLHRNVNVCRAWDEQGHLVAFGDYRLDGENRAARPDELRPWNVLCGPNGNPRFAWIHLPGSKGGVGIDACSGQCGRRAA